jgi:hypothetical protein
VTASETPVMADAEVFVMCNTAPCWAVGPVARMLPRTTGAGAPGVGPAGTGNVLDPVPAEELAVPPVVMAGAIVEAGAGPGTENLSLILAFVT